jgi:hypothetical protein
MIAIQKTPYRSEGL